MSTRSGQVSQLFEAALGQPGATRGSFLCEACAGDVDRQRGVESLLAEHDRSALVDAPIADAAKELLGDNCAVLAGRQIGAFRVGDLLRSSWNRRGRDPSPQE
jgi:hypothetical protein